MEVNCLQLNVVYNTIICHILSKVMINAMPPIQEGSHASNDVII